MYIKLFQESLRVIYIKFYWKGRIFKFSFSFEKYVADTDSRNQAQIVL